MSFIVAASVAAFGLQSKYAAAEAPQALSGAHAHNDYYHKRPLFDALDRGFVSVEADVFLVDGKLLVGHYAHELRPERTLEALYLEPLRKHVTANNGRVFIGDERLTLLVDFKTDGPAAYAALAKLLTNYDGVFFDMKDGKLASRAVDVVITGNRPMDDVTRDKSRRASIDGRLANLDDDAPKDLMPLISESWTHHFQWRGVGPMPGQERERLRQLVDQVHATGKQLRFWATPDNIAVWSELQAAGVDLIGADDLDRLRDHLAQRDESSSQLKKILCCELTAHNKRRKTDVVRALQKR